MLAGTLTLPSLYSEVWPRRTVTDYISIHHTVTEVPADASEEREAAHILMIHRYHQQMRPSFGGIGYHAVCFPSGRWWLTNADTDLPRAGVLHHNDHVVHVALVGNFLATIPPDASIAAAREAVAYMAQRYPGAEVIAHSVLVSTECPGNRWPEWIDRVEPQEEEAEMAMSDEEFQTKLGAIFESMDTRPWMRERFYKALTHWWEEVYNAPSDPNATAGGFALPPNFTWPAGASPNP